MKDQLLKSPEFYIQKLHDHFNEFRNKLEENPEIPAYLYNFLFGLYDSLYIVHDKLFREEQQEDSCINLNKATFQLLSILDSHKDDLPLPFSADMEGISLVAFTGSLETCEAVKEFLKQREATK